MTTDSSRKQTQDFTAERNATNDARQAGAVERGELPSYEEAVKARVAELYYAGLVEEARALYLREFGK